ncbi:MAG: tetratricopeptide repeat protein [Candidatus Omnitrophota bacterium]
MEENIKCLKDMEAALGAQAKKIKALEEQLKVGEKANRQLVNRLNELNSEYSGFLEEVIEDKKNGLEKFNKAKSGFSEKKKEFAPVQEAVDILFPPGKTKEEALTRELKEMQRKFAQDKEAREAKVFSLELELELKHKEWERHLAEKEKNENDLDARIYVLEKEKNVLEKTVEAQLNRAAYYEVVSKEKENLGRLLELTRESYVKQAGSLYYYLGLAYTQAKIYSDALQAYAKSLEYVPNSPEVHCNLGLLYAYQGNNPSKMLYHLREALRLNPQIENREVLKDLIEKAKDE